MPEELEAVLRLVADGRLTPEEAAPIIEALSRASVSDRERTGEGHDDAGGPEGSRLGRRVKEHVMANVAGAFASTGGGSSRQLRIRVTERGRQVVNLRIPIGFVGAALDFVPGLSGEHSQRIREAVRAGAVGPIVDVEDPDGGGVLITIE